MYGWIGEFHFTKRTCRAFHPRHVLCFAGAPSGFYAWLRSGLSKMAKRNAVMRGLSSSRGLRTAVLMATARLIMNC